MADPTRQTRATHGTPKPKTLWQVFEEEGLIPTPGEPPPTERPA